ITWPVINRELCAKAKIKPVAVCQVTDVSERGCEDRENLLQIRPTQYELVPRFFDSLEAGVKGVASMLEVGFEQEGLCFTFPGSVVLAPDERRRPARVVAERHIRHHCAGR